MNLTLALAGLFFLVAIVAIVRYLGTRKKISELKSKMDFALQGDDMMKVSFEGDKTLQDIASDFNQLVKKYQSAQSTTGVLQKEYKEKQKLDDKVKNFEVSLSQLTLLTDIGKQITASLNVEDIMSIVLDSVGSSMDVVDFELLYFQNNKAHCKSVGKDGKIRSYDGDTVAKSNNVMTWSLENNQEVFLNDAKADYGQYVYEPLKTFSGIEPAAAICLPLFLQDRKIGALAVASERKDVYNEYHLEFLRTLASYLAVALDNSNVYQLLEEGKDAIEIEKAKSDDLLLNILPADVAEELKEKGTAEARKFDNVSVLFSDFQNFTGISEKLTPENLVLELNICFKKFDLIMEKYHIEKIKTIGDAYMAAGGMSQTDDKHIKNLVLAGLEMQDFIIQRKKELDAQGKTGFLMRVGINAGPVVAGIVGLKKFQYDIWGDTVNTASRMENSGEVGKVNISQAVYEFIRNDKNFEFEVRGEVEVKNKGRVQMYFVKLAK
jgi:class 3 adenylate cyclase